VLIDEYDQPIINSYIKGYYNKIIDFFKNFFSHFFLLVAAKRNEHIGAVLVAFAYRLPFGKAYKKANRTLRNKNFDAGVNNEY